MGVTQVFTTVDNGNANLLLVQDAILSQDGTLQSISFYVIQVAGMMRLGLYDSTGPGGGPGNIIVQTASFSPSVGWNTRAVSPTPLIAGKYWLAYTPSSNNLAFPVQRGVTGVHKWVQRTYQAMPAVFATNPTTESGPSQWSFYATVSVP